MFKAIKGWVFDKVYRTIMYTMPSWARRQWDEKIAADANRLNAEILSKQGFVRCFICPTRFTIHKVIARGYEYAPDGKKVPVEKKFYLCDTHHRAYLDNRLELLPKPVAPQPEADGNHTQTVTA